MRCKTLSSCNMYEDAFPFEKQIRRRAADFDLLLCWQLSHVWLKLLVLKDAEFGCGKSAVLSGRVCVGHKHLGIFPCSTSAPMFCSSEACRLLTYDSAALHSACMCLTGSVALRKEVKSGRLCFCVSGCVHVCVFVCVPAHMAAFLWASSHVHACVCLCVCACVDKDLEAGLCLPGSHSLSTATFNDLHMGPATSGYSNIPVYSNMREDYFS